MKQELGGKAWKLLSPGSGCEQGYQTVKCLSGSSENRVCFLKDCFSQELFFPSQLVIP